MTRRRRSTAGFTLVELMVVTLLISCLVGIAIPKYQQYRKRATVNAIQGAMLSLRFAVLSATETLGTMPATTTTISAQIQPYLTGAFQMSTSDYSLSWVDIDANSGNLVVNTYDPTVCLQLSQAYGGAFDPTQISASCGGSGGYLLQTVK